MVIYVPGFKAPPPPWDDYSPPPPLWASPLPCWLCFPPPPPVGHDMKVTLLQPSSMCAVSLFPPHPPCGLSAKRSTVDMKEEASFNYLNNDIKFSLYFTMVSLHVATRNHSMDHVGCKSRRCSFQPQLTCVHQGCQRPLRRGTSEDPEFQKET